MISIEKTQLGNILQDNSLQLSAFEQGDACVQRLANALRIGQGALAARSPFGQALLWLGSDFSSANEAEFRSNLAGRLACRLANRLCSDKLDDVAQFQESNESDFSPAFQTLLGSAIYQDHLGHFYPNLKQYEASKAGALSGNSRPSSEHLRSHFVALLTLLPQMEQKEFLQDALSQSGKRTELRTQPHYGVSRLVKRRLVHTILQSSMGDDVLRGLFDNGLSPILAQGGSGLNQLLARPQMPQMLYLNGLTAIYGNETLALTRYAEHHAQALSALLSQNNVLIVMGLGAHEEGCAILEAALSRMQVGAHLPSVFWFSRYSKEHYSDRINALIEQKNLSWIDVSNWESAILAVEAALNKRSEVVPIQPAYETAPRPFAPERPPTQVEEVNGSVGKLQNKDWPSENFENRQPNVQSSKAEIQSSVVGAQDQDAVKPVFTGSSQRRELESASPTLPEELDLDFVPQQNLNGTVSIDAAPLPPMGLRIQTNADRESAAVSNEESATLPARSPSEVEQALQNSHEWEMQGDSARFEGQESHSVPILERAIQYYQQAVDALPDATPSTELSRLHKKLGETYFLICGSSHNAQDLERAIDSYHQSMHYGNKQKSPFVWSDTQHKLGLALASLGEITSDTQNLHQAVSAYEAALEVRTLQETPTDWACTKNFLGIALSTIGVQENHVDSLVQAVAAYQSALLGYSKEADSVDWAGVQNNLGAALANLGERTGEAQYLERATQAFENALSAISKEAMPQDWVMTQSNLAHALAGLGKHSTHLDALEKAIKAYEKVLAVRQREQDPIDWAMTQNNLGHALHSYSEQSNNAEMAFRAVQAFRDTLKAINRDEYPLDWAATQNNLGNALQSLSEQTNDIDSLRQAVDAYEAALEIRKEDLHPLEWAGTQGNLAHALQTLSDRTQDDNLLRRTIIAYKSALSKIEAKSMPINWTVLQNNLGTALRILGERQGSSELLKASIAAYTAAQPFFESAGVGPYVDMVRKNLDLARESLSKLTG